MQKNDQKIIILYQKFKLVFLKYHFVCLFFYLLPYIKTSSSPLVFSLCGCNPSDNCFLGPNPFNDFDWNSNLSRIFNFSSFSLVVMLYFISFFFFLLTDHNKFSLRRFFRDLRCKGKIFLRSVQIMYLLYFLWVTFQHGICLDPS